MLTIIIVIIKMITIIMRLRKPNKDGYTGALTITIFIYKKIELFPFS